MFFILPSIKCKASSNQWNSQRFIMKNLQNFDHCSNIWWICTYAEYQEHNEDQFSDYISGSSKLTSLYDVRTWFDCYKLQVYLDLCMTVFFVIIRDYNCICIFGVKVDRNLTFITLYNNFNLWNKLLNKINDIKNINNTYQSVITGITWSQSNATEKY